MDEIILAVLFLLLQIYEIAKLRIQFKNSITYFTLQFRKKINLRNIE